VLNQVSSQEDNLEQLVSEECCKTYDLTLLFAALSDRTRLRLLNLMDGREVCV
jgi:hypothetical protein